MEVYSDDLENEEFEGYRNEARRVELLNNHGSQLCKNYIRMFRISCFHILQ